MSYQNYPTHLNHPSPDQMLFKLKTPLSVISFSTFENAEEQIIRLENILNKDYNDTESTGLAKQKALTQLKSIVKEWLQSFQTNVPQRCGMEIFGSYKLGASSKNGDIDAVCIVPPYINREQHFFGDFVEILKKYPKASEIFPISMALVPLIKIKFYDVEFDILMCQVTNDILNYEEDRLFSRQKLDIDEKERKSINGCRVAHYLIKNITNYAYFQVALKAIKMWAKNKRIYSQIFCYLGGIGYTILLAKICQLYPNYSPLKLLERFFFIYSKWVWQIPVLLEETDTEFINQRFQMIIMTPICPSMNAAHGVSKSTLRIMKKEFREAYKVIEEIKKGKDWKTLFRKSDFFDKYKFMLEISIMATNKSDFIMWKGHIESKFRKLIKLLESNENSHLIEINPYPQQFLTSRNHFDFCSLHFIGIKSKSYNFEDDNKQIDFTQQIRAFVQHLENYNQIQKFPQEIFFGANIIPRSNISAQILKKDVFYKYE